MPVIHFITHQIDKEPKALAANVTCSQQADFNDVYGAKIAAQLRTLFIARASKRYGEFSVEIPHFKGLLLDWLRNKQSFVALTQRLTQLLSEKLDNTPLEVSGHFAFIVEQLADGDRFYIYHLREKSNIALNEHGALSETRYIDFSNTGFALCIDTQALEQGDATKYVSFSYGRGEKTLQNAFCEVSGFSDTINVAQDTQAFLHIVDAYASELPEQQAQETRTKVVEFCMEQDKYGAAVEFKALSSELDESAPQKFEQFVQKKQHEMQSRPSEHSESSLAGGHTDTTQKTEFIPDRKSLKDYIRYSGKNKDVTLSFSAMALGGDVQFNQNDNSLVLTNLPARLLKQLKHEFKS